MVALDDDARSTGARPSTDDRRTLSSTEGSCAWHSLSAHERRASGKTVEVSLDPHRLTILALPLSELRRVCSTRIKAA